jgi:hypothetical protein
MRGKRLWEAAPKHNLAGKIRRPGIDEHRAEEKLLNVRRVQRKSPYY